MQGRQKICAQVVITVSVGGEMHMGQSKSSPSCSMATNFFSNSGLLDTSAQNEIYHISNKDPS